MQEVSGSIPLSSTKSSPDNPINGILPSGYPEDASQRVSSYRRSDCMIIAYLLYSLYAMDG